MFSTKNEMTKISFLILGFEEFITCNAFTPIINFRADQTREERIENSYFKEKRGTFLHKSLACQ